MKKLLSLVAVLLVCSMALCLASCGCSTGSNDKKSDSFTNGTIIMFSYMNVIDKSAFEQLVRDEASRDDLTFSYAASFTDETKMVSVVFPYKDAVSTDIQYNILKAAEKEFPDNSFKLSSALYVDSVKSAGDSITNGCEFALRPAGMSDVSDKQLKTAVSIVEKRIKSLGIKNYEICTVSDTDYIIVRFSRNSAIKEADAKEDIEKISSMGMLTFREGNDYGESTIDSDGNTVYKTPQGVTEENVLMDGSMVADAEATVSNYTGEDLVLLTFTSEGKEKFAEITEEYQARVVSIWIDDEMISAPIINDVITNGEANISGNFTAKSAKELAAKIKAGALPFKFETVWFSDYNAAD